MSYYSLKSTGRLYSHFLGSSMVICRMGGGSITLRSRSPNPQDRAAIGCWRILILYFELREASALGCCKAGAFEDLVELSDRDVSLLSKPDMLIRPVSRGPA